MIAVDTSALMACLLDEPEAEACKEALKAASQLFISAGTVAEALIVAGRRGYLEEMVYLVEELDFEIVPITAAGARRIGAIYARWGKGVHAAGLNMGDCFAYEVAQERSCPLLFVGNDFSKTDLRSAL